MSKLCGLMIFSIGLGLVLSLVLIETSIIILVAGVCLLCGYHIFCR